MQFISLNNSSLTKFIAKPMLSELSGSSKYKVFDNELVKTEKRKPNKIENTTALKDYFNQLLSDNMTDEIGKRIRKFHYYYLKLCIESITPSKENLENLDKYNKLLEQLLYASSDYVVKSKLIDETMSQSKSRYQTQVKARSNIKRLNKSKIKGKMNALFNLKRSRKFIAFITVSFPDSMQDEESQLAFSYWLNYLRKHHGLNDYIWVIERQKNGNLHYHMLTNNWMPIQQINREMAIIINNILQSNSLSWGKSSLEKYNGVDVDSIYNSKRHKNTGKTLNPTEIRNWISKYVTKYVTKNSDLFTIQSWHCSRSMSHLFSALIYTLKEGLFIFEELLKDSKRYYYVKSDYNETYIFKFVPPPKLFEKLYAYNDYIDYLEHEKHVIKHKKTTFKTKSL